MRESHMDQPQRSPRRWGLRQLGSCMLLLASCAPEAEGFHGGLRILVVDEPVGAHPVGGALVRLQGFALAGSTSSSGFLTFSALPTGSYVIVAGRIGYCTASHPVTVAANVTTDLVVPLCPAPGSGPSDGGNAGGPDKLSVPTPGAQPGVLLFDAAAGGNCLRDQLVPGHTEYSLLLNALPPGSTDGGGHPCPTSATLFTPAHGLRFTDDPAQLAWTGGTDNLAVPLVPLLNLPIAIWVAPGVGSPGLTDQIHTIHLKQAQAIFSAAGAGLALVGDEQAGGDPLVVDILGTSPGAALFPATGTGCDDATAIMAEPSVYRVDMLNVYYVRQITGRGSASTGYYCFIEGARPILFIRTPEGLPHTLAHELGHALGLLEPNWGHTHDYLSGFLMLPPPGPAPRNFMAYGAAGDAGRPIYATLGQAFRMNLSPLSWVNLPGSSGSSLRQRASAAPASVACPCAAADATDDCPVLTLTGSVPDYLTTGPGWELACTVTPAVDAITLCRGEVRPIRATFWTTLGGVAVPARSPEITWVSDDPAVAALDPGGGSSGVDGSGSGWAEQRVTGGMVGLATVSLFAGGPSATGRYAIEVKACA